MRLSDRALARLDAALAVVLAIALGIALAGLAGVLGGCSEPRIVYKPVEVRVPVPVSCIDRLPERPALRSDADLIALDDYGLVIALGRDRIAAAQYIRELEALLPPCLSAGRR